MDLGKVKRTVYIPKREDEAIPLPKEWPKREKEKPIRVPNWPTKKPAEVEK